MVEIINIDLKIEIDIEIKWNYRGRIQWNKIYGNIIGII